MSSGVLTPYRSLVAEVHRRLQRLVRCVHWMLEHGHREPARDLLTMLHAELAFHHALAQRRLHPVLAVLSPGRDALLSRLVDHHRSLEEEVGRVVNLLSLGCDFPLILKRTERLQESLGEHLALEAHAFSPLEALVAVNADAVAPGS